MVLVVGKLRRRFTAVNSGYKVAGSLVFPN